MKLNVTFAITKSYLMVQGWKYFGYF